MEPLDSDAIYYTAVGQLQQSYAGNPTAEAIEVDDVILSPNEAYFATVVTHIGRQHVSRTYVFDEHTIEVGYSTDAFSGSDYRGYSAVASFDVTAYE